MTLAPVSASSLKDDEQVIFFPTSAHMDKENGTWTASVHGWIFEPEEDSIWRSALIEELLKWMELDGESVDNRIFRSRARMFLVDNERGKQFRVVVDGQTFETQSSTPGGHFSQDLTLDQDRIRKLAAGSWIPFRIDPDQTAGRKTGGRFQVVPPDGLSVISDIDDTIKISNVLDKKELMENTFLREFEPVPGMSDLYRGWARSDVVFHYVSGSPWQLYPALEEFMSAEGFPTGSFSLRDFRVKDRTFFNLFASPEKSKAPAIESILTRYPGRQFILVGDSGEEDPEIYGSLARLYTDQVLHIFIRNVPDSDVSANRFRAAFEGLGEEKWTVFSDPGELEGVVEIRDKR